MAAARQQQQTVDTTLAAVVAHPLRARAFMVLAERTASPNEVAQILGVELNDIAYHIRKLAKLNVIELVDTKPVRGAVEHFYRAIKRPLVWAKEYALLDQSERNDFAREICQLMFADVSAALASGIFSSRSDNCVSRAPLLVDEEGWAELSAIFEGALTQTLEVQARSADRMTRSGEEGIHITASTLLFEREVIPASTG